MTVGTRTGQLLSELILGGRPATIETAAAAEQVLASLSRTTLVLGTIFIVTVAVLQGRPRLALISFLTVVGANLTTQVLKSLVLDRSDLLDGLFYPLPNSFPSGHATAAASIAVALVLVLPPLLRAPSVLITALVVGVVGASTMVAGWHRMADAIGGVFVATAWGAGLAAILTWQRGIEVVGRRTAAFGRVTASVPVLLGVGILVLGGIGYLLIAADPLGVLSYLAKRGGSPALFWVAVAVTVGSCSMALGALGLALRDIRLDPSPAAREPVVAAGSGPDDVAATDLDVGPADRS